MADTENDGTAKVREMAKDDFLPATDEQVDAIYGLLFVTPWIFEAKENCLPTIKRLVWRALQDRERLKRLITPHEVKRD